jgi:YbbR domain-containing protein
LKRKKMFSLNGRKLLAKAAENWPAKVLSIALALILSVFHRMSTLEDRFFSAPLTVELSPSLTPASSYTRMIRVTLRGDANSIFPILEDDIEPYVDLRKYSTEGSYRVPVQVRKKGTAVGVEPLEISVEPVEISLELDRKISKYMPITANIRGSPETGYDLGSYTLSPTQVIVDGPMNILEDISELYTDFIDLEGKTGDFSVVVNILNRDPLLAIRGTGTVEFRGFVQRLVPVRNIDAVPIAVNGLDPRFTADLTVKAGSVRVEGSQSELDGFLPPENFLSVDCSLLSGPGVYTLPVSVNLPSSFNLVRMEPREVNVTVTSENGGGS